MDSTADKLLPLADSCGTSSRTMPIVADVRQAGRIKPNHWNHRSSSASDAAEPVPGSSPKLCSTTRRSPSQDCPHLLKPPGDETGVVFRQRYSICA